MERTEPTNPQPGNSQIIKSVKKRRPSSPIRQTQNYSSGLKKFLERANFDTNFKLTATSVPLKTTTTTQPTPVRLGAGAAIVPHKGGDQASAYQTLLDASSPSRLLTPSALPLPTTSRNSSSEDLMLPNSNAKTITGDMGGPGLGSSRYARPEDTSTSYSNTFGEPRSSGLSIFAAPAQDKVTTSKPSTVANGTINAIENTPFASPPAAFFAAPTGGLSATPVSTLLIRNNENTAPAGALAAVSSRLAGLRARRDASMQLTDKTGASFSQDESHPAIDRAMPNQNLFEATGLESERITRTDASAEANKERIAQEKADADRLQAELIAKEKAEDERRAKIQAELDAVLARIKELEGQEQLRIVDYDKEVENAQTELANAQIFCTEIKDEKAEVHKLVQDLEKQFNEVQSRLEKLHKKADGVQVDLEEALAIIAESEKVLSDLKATNTGAVSIYTKAVDELSKDKIRLEQSLTTLNETTEDMLVQSVTANVTPSKPVLRTPSLSVKFKPEVTVEPSTSKSRIINGSINGLPTLNAWPEQKPRAPSTVRSVRLENLPSSNNLLSNVSRLIFHGALHSFRYEPGNSWAEASFIKPEDCQKYVETTKNGIPWPEEPGRIVVTQPCDPESGDLEYLKIIIKNDLSRCVRIVGIDPEWKPKALKHLAENPSKQSIRKLDRLINGHDSKARRICDFQFCKVADAVTFKAQIDKDEDFAKCQISFAIDPCMAGGIRKGPVAKPSVF